MESRNLYNGQLKWLIRWEHHFERDPYAVVYSAFPFRFDACSNQVLPYIHSQLRCIFMRPFIVVNKWLAVMKIVDEVMLRSIKVSDTLQGLLLCSTDLNRSVSLDVHCGHH